MLDSTLFHFRRGSVAYLDALFLTMIASYQSDQQDLSLADSILNRVGASVEVSGR